MNHISTNITQSARIYFMRHAETEYNKNHYITGNAEIELSEEGVAQAVQTAEYFKDKHISLVLHSPLSRTLRTAKLVAENHIPPNTPYQLCKDLIEMGAGTWTHKSFVDIQKESPQDYALFKLHSWERVPEAEKIVSLVERANRVWATLVEEIAKGHQDILVVSHGGFLNWMFKTSFGSEGTHLQSWSPIIRTNNCGIHEFVIEAREGGCFCTWKTINHTCYN